MSLTTAPTTTRCYPPAAAFCAVCGDVMPRDWRGRCVDCTAEAEAAPRRSSRRRRTVPDAAARRLAPPRLDPLTVAQKLSRLTPRQREYFSAFHGDGQTVGQVAIRFGVSPASVSTGLARAVLVLADSR